MEGVPKLLMLNFQPKQSSDNSDFVLKLRKLIRVRVKYTCFSVESRVYF